MDWEHYIQSVLKEEKCLDNITISIDGKEIALPSIIKASVFMLEKMIQNQGKNNVFVFPDGEQIPFLFMISKLIFNIYSGKIENQYTPEDFIPGQILKLGNCVVEFLGIGDEPLYDGIKRIYLRFADCDKYYCPIEMVPYFQKSDTKKKLSKMGVYRREKKRIDEEQSAHENYLHELKEIKTHVKKTLFYIAPISNSQDKAHKILIDGSSLFEYFLVTITEYTGEMKYLKGKLVGTPALSFASEIDYVNEAINNGANAQSVILNLTECNIENQLAALDTLLQYKIPILCITDTANSFDLGCLEERKFNIWRWDEDSISNGVRSNEEVKLAEKIEKCMKSKVCYHGLSAPEISMNFNILYHYNRIVENESAKLNAIFSRLLTISYSMLRNIRVVDENEKISYVENLEFCKKALEEEKIFIDESIYSDFKKVIENFEKIVCELKPYPKTEAIYEFLISERIERFYLICANNDSPQLVKEYWENRLAKSGYRPNITVMYAKDFLKIDKHKAAVAIIAGWLGASVLRKIIYGYWVEEIHIYTYECEERWKKAHTKSWRVGLNNQNNKVIAEKSFSNQTIKSCEVVEKDKMTDEDQTVICEKDDLDLIIQENRYRQYMSRGGQMQGTVVDAKPVGFVGGEFALYTNGHKILVASKIIAQSTNKIEKKEIEELVIGDFIVVRESSKDIIREVADIILAANNKLHYRKLAAIWKEALKIEFTFYSIEHIFTTLSELGCTRNIQTVRNWLTSDDIIIPQDKEDLEYIAQMTNDSVLIEKIDEIFDAGTYIKNAHIKAGRILSERLTEGIAKKLLSGEKIDPYNIWDPIELNLKEVGPVRVLKVIDLGQEWIPVSITDTNKILSEEKESLLWQE